MQILGPAPANHRKQKPLYSRGCGANKPGTRAGKAIGEIRYPFGSRLLFNSFMVQDENYLASIFVLQNGNYQVSHTSEDLRTVQYTRQKYLSNT